MPLEPFIIGIFTEAGKMKCKYCGKEFERFSDFGRIPKYCSAECRYEADKENKRLFYKGKRQEKCVFCGERLPKNKTKYCSDLCARKDRDIKLGIIQAHGVLTKTCIICGREFKTWKSKKVTCSEICSQKRHNSDRRLKGRVIDKDITLKALARRDKDQCQICGLMVNWDDTMESNGRTIYGRMYPSIDHIKPLSLNGLHAWDNVQLAHIGCNRKKSNKFTTLKG